MKTTAPILKENLDTHWFVIANQRTMKIFKADEHQHFHLLYRIDASLSHGKSKSPQYLENKKHQAREINALHFAREIAEFLQTQKRAGHFNSLTIAAEPRFMGKIKAVLPFEVKSSFPTWLHKDLEKTPDHDLPQHLISTGQMAL